MMTWLAALVLAGIGTFALRFGSVRSFEERTMRPVVTRMLRHAALAILASLAITNLPHATAADGPTAASIIGLAVTVVAARRLSNLTAIMAIGIGAYAATAALTG
jgi:branched-subunit amino acid transport protein